MDQIYPSGGFPMTRQKYNHFQTARKERAAYCLFFLGQNILWGYAGYVETFLTDIGIAAATAGVILLLPKPRHW
mgnify:CR=1 FL=1